MKTTTSLSFSKNGLLNPESVDFFVAKKMDSLVVFTDGTEEAYQHLLDYNFSSLIADASHLGIGRLPLWDLRVINADGTFSKPNYVYSDQNQLDWFCANICAPCVQISVSDITSQSDTKVMLTRHQIELMCDMSLRFWHILQVAEDHLGFPAIAIDALTRWSRVLSPETIDIPSLRSETGLTTLDYNLHTDLLELTVASEVFTVKLSVLDQFFKNTILPFFNKYQGRRYRLEVSVLGITDHAQKPQTMSYGELGRVLDQMQSLIKKQRITHESPMDEQDLLAFAKKVKIHEESCLLAQGYQTISDFIKNSKDTLVRHNESYDPSDLGSDSVNTQPVLEHV